MAKFLVRRFFSLVLTMLLVSIVIFVVAEIVPGDPVRHILGQFATPEQEESYRKQLGLDRPVWQRYLSWLVGSDWLFVRPHFDMPLAQTVSPETGFAQWWAEEPDGTLVRWRMEGDDLIALRRHPDGSRSESVDNERWQIDREAERERLVQFREELVTSVQLTAQDKESLLTQLDRLIYVLNDDQLSDADLKAQIADPEQAIAALLDPDAARQRQALQTASAVLAQDDLVRTVRAVEDFVEGVGGTGQDERDWLAGRLGLLAAPVSRTRPELADDLRRAAASLREGQVGEAREVLDGAITPLQELAQMARDLSQSLADDNYLGTAELLEGFVELSDPPDELKMSMVGGQLGGAARELTRHLPEFAASLTEAAAGLAEGDAAAADAALAEATSILRDRGPVLARSAAVERGKVGRFYWGVDTGNRATLWQTQTDEDLWMRSLGAGWWVRQPAGPVRYIPLTKGLVRGDFGESIRTRQPVIAQLGLRVRNSAVLAGIAFGMIMPLALVMGLIAGVNEGKLIDRVLSLFGLVTTSSPNFATGVFLILIFAIRLQLFPGATVFTDPGAIFRNPQMLVLPVATLTLIDCGYVMRITRASMLEVLDSQYIRTATLKGLSRRRVIFRHAFRNALMAPITVIMLHVNWLLGGIVVVEAIFGFPGLGTYILTSALYNDIFAIEAAAMVMVVLAVGTQLMADIIYTFLNPRIRYA